VSGIKGVKFSYETLSLKRRTAEQRPATSPSVVNPGSSDSAESNIQTQNIEGWNSCALSFETIKIDRILYFDIWFLLLCKSAVFFSIKLAAPGASG